MEIDGRTAEEERIGEVCPVPGADASEPNALRSVSASKEVVEVADDPAPAIVKRTMTSTGARIAVQFGGGFEGGESVSGSVSSTMSLKKSLEEEEEESFRSREKNEEAVIESVSGPKIEGRDNAVVTGSGSDSRMSFEEFLKATNTKVMTTEEYLQSEAKEEPVIKQSGENDSMSVLVKDEPSVCFGNDRETVMVDDRLNDQVKVVNEGVSEKEVEPMDIEPTSWLKPVVPLKEEPIEAIPISCSKLIVPIKKEPIDSIPVSCSRAIVPLKVEPINAIPVSCSRAIVPLKIEPINAIPVSCLRAIVPVKEESDLVVVVKDSPPSKVTNETFLKKFNRIPAKRGLGSSQNPSSDAKKGKIGDPNQKACSIPVEDGDFPDDPDWFLVGRTMVNAVSTTKGRKLVDNEIVHFSCPRDWRSNAQWILRFSTKRNGEIGRLPMDWGKCVVPLINSGKVKVYGRCVAAPPYLSIMQEILLYVSFYIHHSIFMEDKDSSWGWKLEAVNIDSTIYPLLTLFKWLKIKPYQKAEFTPEELDSRKRLLNLEAESDEPGSMLPIVNRRKGCQQYPEQGKDEQAVSESSLNKLVGAAEASHLKEMEPPSSLTCHLKSYQKQALHWMSELEKGIDVEKAAKTLHPCWAAYRIADERASSIYVNLFSGEATTKFPTAMQMARGGILADAMGLGKTVMTIALLLRNRGRGISDKQGNVVNVSYGSDMRTDSHMDTSSKPKCGTLIVCPMALLGQWKDELETHSEPESISIFVHYGGGRTYSPKVFAKHDVVLTTYGVLTQAHKNEGEDSIFHKVDWYRVVLDEAHTIKSWKTQGARASFTLSSHCRWCLTGTPIQNNLEDLYSLLCFLHVEPWCNWAWWNKLIQKPYENGDPRGLRLIKAILRPIMLRRTKESKDKEGRPILVLPPTDIQIIECEQSEAEQDFYDALFKRSKVQFDQFVAQGKVLHNYASILELLLRLRQCCNHPFLVMSRCDTQKFTDLNKLAKRFLEADPDSDHSARNAPTKAYVEEVVDGIRRGENSECPICLESADDPVLTPCAHRMCRECLLSSWRSPAAGICPICRQVLRKTDLITCPSESKFQVDIVKNWKESSKVSSLLHCLERIRRSGSDEKSIVFSQWTTFLDLLEIPLKGIGIGYLRYDGRLSQSQREKVLYEFNQTNNKMVLLMSLRAGGVGLNLTAASNVFLMDPWWNPAVEEQAIMRIHRIGQKRTVSVRRFIVKGTVEERMQQVQARKQRLIAGALTDEEVRSARIEELKMLFR